MNFHHPFDTALAQALMHSLWQVSLLAMVAAATLGSLGRRRAALRHAVGLVFLLAMAVLPVVTFAFLAWGPSLRTISWSAGSAAVLEGTVVISRPVSVPAPLWVPWLWFGGVGIMLLRLFGGWWVVRKLDRSVFCSLPADWKGRLQRLRRAMGIRREVSVRLLEDLGLPCSTRAWRPVIWIPLLVLTQLTPDQFEALLAHELAHIRRLDWIWNGLQCLVEALYFYHPGVWWLSRRIRQERELACDDLAVALCGDAIALAEALATLEGLRPQRQPPPQGMAHVLAPSLSLGANGGSLMNRIQHLLSPPPPPRFRWSLPAAILAVLGSGALLVAQANRPQEPAPAGNTVETPALARGSNVTIRDDSDGIRRAYRKQMSLLGQLTETYTENGQTKSIDDSVRQWIGRQERLAVKAEAEARMAEAEAHNAEDAARKAETEARKAEDHARRAEADSREIMAPPPPPPPPVPEPPAPPEPPTLQESAAFHQALAQAQGNARLQALLGSPILAGPQIKGSISSWGPGDSHFFSGLVPVGSKAEFWIPLSGPKGSASLHATGKLVQGVWRFSKLEVVQPQDARVNLLAAK